MGLNLNSVEHGSLSGLGCRSKTGESAIGLQTANRLDRLSEKNKMRCKVGDCCDGPWITSEVTLRAH